MSGDPSPLAIHRLRDVVWPRFLRAPDAQLLEELYIPALSRAVRYDRVCAYFSSRILATAARGFGGLISNLLALGDAAPRPAVRLIVNEQLHPDDLDALLATGDTSKLERELLKGLTKPQDALTKNRLQMLAWLVKGGLLEVRVGMMRRTHGMLHAKYGIITDAHGDMLTFMGSDNETDAALVENYEELALSPAWRDPEGADYFRSSFETLWANQDEHVQLIPLPEAVKLKLIKFAPLNPPVELLHHQEEMKTAMIWRFLAAAAYLPNGAAAVDATAPVVAIWPHQQRVVEDTATNFPEGRLLCDEVGMGKTVEAILALRRLLTGRGVERALLLVPAGLLPQWQDELREKGGLIVPRLGDNGYLYWPDGRSERPEITEVLAQQNLLLLSREWARLQGNRELLLTAPTWDLVLLDEAHAARRGGTHGEREFNSSNLLLNLLRQFQLRQRTRGILLMSATPMQTQPWEPWDLLGVLGVGGPWQVDFADIRAYYQAIADLRQHELDMTMATVVSRLLAQSHNVPPPPGSATLPDEAALTQRLAFTTSPSERHALADWLRASAPLALRMHRNTRKTLHRYHKLGLLPSAPPRREVQDVRFDYAIQEERDTYQAIETYINRRYEQMEKEKAGKGFVMTIYRRRASSSPLAFRRSLEHRLKNLENVIQKHHQSDWLLWRDEDLDIRDLGDADVDERIDLGLPTTATLAQAERADITRLVARLDALGATDSKLALFWQVLDSVTDDGRAALVFTEYTDTLDYLRDQLRPTYGNTLGCYSGRGGEIWDGTRWVKVSKAEITTRLGHGQLKVLICTDAASEGLNLQAASALINYDLPWNPSKVEQRIGRIDRIGQKESLLPVRNLFLENSVDDQVYKALRERCGLFEHFVGQMQPVLALAREAFSRNLRHDQVSDLLGALRRKADEVDHDVATSNAYIESDAVILPKATPSVDRDGIGWALNLLVGASGKVKAKRMSDGVWRITGVPTLKQLVTTVQAVLERDEGVVPLTLVGDAIADIAKSLPLHSLSPLVIGKAIDGVYHASEVRWADRNGVQVVDSLDHLRQLLDKWDGTLSAAADIVAAESEADQKAAQRVDAMKASQQHTFRAGIEGQLAAAQRRLRRELARNLRCIGNGNLSQLFRQQMQGKSVSSHRFSLAFNRLKGPPPWTLYEEVEATKYVDDLTDAQRQQRINLASELDSALNDPRWLAL